MKIIVRFLPMLIIYCLLLPNSALSQNCGYEMNSKIYENEVAKAKAKKQQKTATPTTLNTTNTIIYNNPNVIFELKVWNAQGQGFFGLEGGVSFTDMQTAVCNLNLKFAPIGIQFSLQSNNFHTFVDNGIYFNINANPNTNIYYDRQCINIYLTLSVPGGGDGYANNAREVAQGAEPRLWVRQGALMNSSTLPHEMGHIFGLYHTFQGWGSRNPNTPIESLEKADGSNCDVAGDLVCDTPADPDYQTNSPVTSQPGQSFYNTNCTYGGTGYYQAFRPLANNLMAYISSQQSAQPLCRNAFTWGQYDRMKETYNFYDDSFFYPLLQRTWTPPTIQGPSELSCPPATAQYTMGGLGNVTVRWSSPSGNLIINPTVTTLSNQPVTVRRTSASGGVAYLQAEIEGGCHPPIIKEINGTIPDPSKIGISANNVARCWAGTAYIDFFASYNGVFLADVNYSTRNGTAGIDKVEWVVNGQNASLNFENLGISCNTPQNIICNGRMTLQTVPDQTGIVISLRVRSQCSGQWSGWRFFPVSRIICGGGGVYPCGRVGSFSVVAKTKDEKTQALTEMVGEVVNFEAKLYDINGNVVKEGKSNGKHRIDWNTSDLKEGQYILKTEYNGKVESQHVMVNSTCCGGGGGC
jgi:Pregnancy-associated plasma protein-A